MSGPFFNVMPRWHFRVAWWHQCPCIWPRIWDQLQQPLNSISIEQLDPAWVEDIPRVSVCICCKPRAIHFLISPWCPLIFVSNLFQFQPCSTHVIGFLAQIHICFKSLGWMIFCDLWRSPGDDSDWTQWWRSCDWGAESQGRWTIKLEPGQSAPVSMGVAGCLWVFEMV